MDRKRYKELAKRRIRGTKRVTLVFLLTILVLSAAELGLETLSSQTTSTGQSLSRGLSAGASTYATVMVLSLVLQMLQRMSTVGYEAFGLAASRSEPFSMGTLLRGVQLWSRVILLELFISLLTALWSCLGMIPVSYLLLLVAEGMSEEMLETALLGAVFLVMAVVSYRYRMAWFVLLDHPELSIRQIVTETRTINRGHRLWLFVTDLSFLPWMLLSVVTCGILLLWKLPYMVRTYAHAYQAMAADYGR